MAKVLAFFLHFCNKEEDSGSRELVWIAVWFWWGNVLLKQSYDKVLLYYLWHTEDILGRPAAINEDRSDTGWGRAQWEPNRDLGAELMSFRCNAGSLDLVGPVNQDRPTGHLQYKVIGSVYRADRAWQHLVVGCKGDFQLRSERKWKNMYLQMGECVPAAPTTNSSSSFVSPLLVLFFNVKRNPFFPLEIRL